MNRRLLLMFGCSLFAYLAIYAASSQLQIQTAKSMRLAGFYYVMPEEEHPWRFHAHTAVRILFSPCDLVRVGVFDGMTPARSEPLFRLGDKAE